MRLVGLTFLMALSACKKTPEAPREVPMPSVSSKAAPSSWEAKLGQVITVEGKAEDAKLGALLDQGADMIWIDGLDAWPRDLRGKHVRVTGKVVQRSDLPVFIHQEGEPEMQGIPVPPGTDMEKARRRFLLAEARWKVVE